MVMMATVHVHAQTEANLSSRKPRSLQRVTVRLASAMLTAIQVIRASTLREHATIARAHAFLESAIVPAQSFESVIYHAT